MTVRTELRLSLPPAVYHRLTPALRAALAVESCRRDDVVSIFNFFADPELCLCLTGNYVLADPGVWLFAELRVKDERRDKR